MPFKSNYPAAKKQQKFKKTDLPDTKNGDEFLDYLDFLRNQHNRVAIEFEAMYGINRIDIPVPSNDKVVPKSILAAEHMDNVARVYADKASRNVALEDPRVADMFFNNLRSLMIKPEEIESERTARERNSKTPCPVGFMNVVFEGELPEASSLSVAEIDRQLNVLRAKSAAMKKKKLVRLDNVEESVNKLDQHLSSKDTLKQNTNNTTDDKNNEENHEASNEELDEESKPVTIKKSIHQRKFEEYMAEVRAKEEEEISNKFVAKPIPKTSLVPLYNQIMEKMGYKDQARLERIRKLRETSARKPTLLVGSGDGSAFEHFKASPVPEYLNQLQDKSREEEEERKKRIAERAQWLRQQARLPSRMAMTRSANMKSCRCPDDKTCTFHPELNHKIPNFSKMTAHVKHAQELKEAEDRRKMEELSKPIQKPTKMSWESIESNETTDTERRQRVLRAPKVKARETVSFALKREANMRLLEAQKEHEQKKLLEEKARQAKLQELSRRIQTQMVQMYSATEHQHVQRAHDFVRYQKQLTNEYKKQLDNMYDRLDKRPFLFERISLENAKQTAGKQFDDNLAC